MGFVEFMLGKRLLEDDFEKGINALGNTRGAKRRRVELAANQSHKIWDEFLTNGKQTLSLPGAGWTVAGPLVLQPSGEIAVPLLPETPGIVLLEMFGVELADYVALLSEHDSMAAADDGWADEEAAAHLIRGGRFVLSYVNKVRLPSGPLDLTSAANRRSVVRSIEKQAEQSGIWLLQPLGERNALVPNPDAVVA